MPIDSENREPLVSVIIPTYNRLMYLKDAIESAVQQTYQNIEIIVSDDCSPESPQEIVDSFQDPRIRFWINETNLGMHLNTINAFRAAKGKYVASLNDDDMWNPDFLAKQVPILEANPDLALVFCDHYVVDADGTINDAATEENTRYWKRDRLKEGVYQPFWKIGIVDQSIFSAAAAVIRRDAIDWDAFPEGAGVFWDLYTTYLAGCSGLGAYYYPERLTRYRTHPKSETAISGSVDVQAKLRKAKAAMFCYGSFAADPRLKEFKSYFQQQWAHANTTMGIGLLRAKQLKEARLYFWHALKQQKLNLRTLIALILSFTPPSIASRF